MSILWLYQVLWLILSFASACSNFRMFSRILRISSTISSSSVHHGWLTVSPPAENILSEVALDAGMAKIYFASFDRTGKFFSFTFHQSKQSQVLLASLELSQVSFMSRHFVVRRQYENNFIVSDSYCWN